MSIKSFKIRIYNERNIQTKRQNHVKSSKKTNRIEQIRIIRYSFEKKSSKKMKTTHISHHLHTHANQTHP